MVIGILGPKGGCGKTTLATNLARAIYLEGASVLLIDSDPQGTARDWHASQPENYDSFEVVGMEPRNIARGLGHLSASYDVVVIDGAAKFEGSALDLVESCDVVLIPVQPTPADVWGAADLVNVIKPLQERTGRPLAAFVVSRQIPGTNLAAGVSDILEAYGLPVFEARTSQRVAYAEAMIDGRTVLDVEPEGKAASEIRAIAQELKLILDNG